MIKYYTQDNFENIEKAKDFKDLFKVALDILQRMPCPVAQVCGPISTGGKGNPKDNLKALDEAIKYLDEQGKNIFYQIPFENKIVELDKKWKAENPGEKYCYPILEEIYRPIFESGFIKTLYFLPDWQSSRGASWERDQAKRLCLDIVDLPNI